MGEFDEAFFQLSRDVELVWNTITNVEIDHQILVEIQFGRIEIDGCLLHESDVMHEIRGSRAQSYWFWQYASSIA